MLKIVILTHKNLIACNAQVYKPCDNQKDIFCDILLVMPEFDLSNFNICTKIAIVCGDLENSNFMNIKYNQIITYGMSSKNTVTISSCGVNQILIAIQREIINIKGEKIEISEHLCDKITENQIESLAFNILFIINGNQP